MLAVKKKFIQRILFQTTLVKEYTVEIKYLKDNKNKAEEVRIVRY